MEEGEAQVLLPLAEHEICNASKHVGTPTTPKLCDKCKSFLRKLTQHQGHRDADRIYGMDGFDDYSVRRGCYLCLCVSKAWKLFSDLPWQLVSIAAHRPRSLQIKASTAKVAAPSHPGSMREDLEVCLGHIDGAMPDASDMGDAWRTLTLNSQKFHAVPTREHSLDFLENRVRRCLETHKKCRLPVTTTTRVYLSRLLFIGSDVDDHCKVVDCRPRIRWQYAALNYCWGASKFIQISKRTCKTYKQAVPTTALPNAFRDAILICRRLNIRYLWIDSLCILQDDMNDWANESAKMADIYEGAVLVIAATSTTNPHCSFLEQGEALQQEPIEIESESLCGRFPAVKARRRLKDSGWHIFDDPPNNNGNDPLGARGWALQERTLATRYISFAVGEVQWQCKTLEECECGPLVRPTGLQTGSLETALSLSPSEAWDQTIKCYTHKLLSYEQDRLPAVAGIATRFAQLTGLSYFCGLWLQTIVDDLCWMISDREWPHDTAKGWVYTGPTFSWVLRNGPV